MATRPHGHHQGRQEAALCSCGPRGRREISPRYLSEDERVRIADLRRAGPGCGRSRSRRAAARPRSAGSCAGTGTRAAASTGRSPRTSWLSGGGPGPAAARSPRDEVLRQFVQDRLAERWSPEQISQALRGEFPGEAARHVVHETIYQAVYRPELGGLVPRVAGPGAADRAGGGAGRTAGRASAARTGLPP